MRRLYWQFYNVDSSIQDNENNTESTNLSEKGSLDNILPQDNDLSFLQPQVIQGSACYYVSPTLPTLPTQEMQGFVISYP